MDIEIVAYVLAIALGVVCWLLVKHTADEYDRWYEQPRFFAVPIRVPAAVISLLVLVGAFLLLR
jgi:hypothetical protein